MATAAPKLRRPTPVLIALCAAIVLGGLLASVALLRPSSRDGASSPAESAARVDEFEFFSPLLGRDMPIKVFLPPGYESGDRRYAVIYMLHGLDPAITKNWEWEEFGLFWQAENRMSGDELPSFIIALPQGEQSYWVDQYEGPSWSKYVAQDVVAAVDTRYRTLANASGRAIGGLSMGADGALQIALTNPGVFSVVGMHAPALRPQEYAAAFYGDYAHFNAYFPPSLVLEHPDAARALAIELDAGDDDDWLANTEAFHQQLDELGIPHTWNRWPGKHDGFYWGVHVPEYLQFYAAALGLTTRE